LKRKPKLPPDLDSHVRTRKKYEDEQEKKISSKMRNKSFNEDFLTLKQKRIEFLKQKFESIRNENDFLNQINDSLKEEKNIKESNNSELLKHKILHKRTKKHFPKNNHRARVKGGKIIAPNGAKNIDFSEKKEWKEGQCQILCTEVRIFYIKYCF